MGDSSYMSKIKCMADVLILVHSIADDGEPSRTGQHNVAKVNMQFPQFEVTMADKIRIPAPSQSARFSDQSAASRGWRGVQCRSAATALVGLPRLIRLL